MNRRRARRGAGGFTILDTMVASGVMIVGVVGLLSMQLTQVGAGMRARQFTEAAALLQQQMELLQLQPAVSGGPVQLDARGCPVGAVSPPARCAAATPGTTYSLSWQVVATGPGTAGLNATVTWQDPDGQTHSLSAADAR